MDITNGMMKITIEDITKEDIKEIIEMLMKRPEFIDKYPLHDPNQYPIHTDKIIMYSIGNQ